MCSNQGHVFSGIYIAPAVKLHSVTFTMHKRLHSLSYNRWSKIMTWHGRFYPTVQHSSGELRLNEPVQTKKHVILIAQWRSSQLDTEVNTFALCACSVLGLWCYTWVVSATNCPMLVLFLCMSVFRCVIPPQEFRVDKVVFWIRCRWVKDLCVLRW